jgi:hypothetical protein
VTAGLVALAACGGTDNGSDAATGTDDAGHCGTEEVEADVRGEQVATPEVTGPVTGGERGVPFNPLPARLVDEPGLRRERGAEVLGVLRLPQAGACLGQRGQRG